MSYRHELWKDYENSEYTGNRNFTKTRNVPERKFRKLKKFNLKTAIKSFESHFFYSLICFGNLWKYVQK
jgi:hypothetical protein